MRTLRLTGWPWGRLLPPEPSYPAQRCLTVRCWFVCELFDFYYLELLWYTHHVHIVYWLLLGGGGGTSSISSSPEIRCSQPAVLAHVFLLSTPKAEARGSLSWGQTALHSQYQASQSFSVRPCLRNQTQNSSSNRNSDVVFFCMLFCFVFLVSIL